jgi:ribosomal protein S27AE
VSNTRRLRPRAPDADELAFRAELAKGCPRCGSSAVTARFRGRWEYTLRCRPDCPSWTGALNGFTGHTIGSEAARRAGMFYRAIDGITGGVVVAASA